MFLDISNIDDDGLAFDQSLLLTGVGEETPDLLEAPRVTVRGAVRPGPSRRNPAEGAVLDGELDATLRLRCSRCLEDVRFPCRVSLHFVLVAEIPAPAAREEADTAWDTQFFQIEAGKLALDDLAAEQVYLEMPLKPLCREDCAGLCPTCGINRNRLECDCRTTALDPRLAALQQIRDRMGKP